jgi:hypothetical protein
VVFDLFDVMCCGRDEPACPLQKGAGSMPYQRLHSSPAPYLCLNLTGVMWRYRGDFHRGFYTVCSRPRCGLHMRADPTTHGWDERGPVCPGCVHVDAQMEAARAIFIPPAASDSSWSPSRPDQPPAREAGPNANEAGFVCKRCKARSSEIDFYVRQATGDAQPVCDSGGCGGELVPVRRKSKDSDERYESDDGEEVPPDPLGECELQRLIRELKPDKRKLPIEKTRLKIVRLAEAVSAGAASRATCCRGAFETSCRAPLVIWFAESRPGSESAQPVSMPRNCQPSSSVRRQK